MMSNDFSKSNGEPTLYIKTENGNVLILVLYVDHLIFTGNDKTLIGEFKEAMKNEFEMTNLGLLEFFLGIEVKQIHDGIFHLSREVCKSCIAEIQNVEQQGSPNTNNPRPKVEQGRL